MLPSDSSPECGDESLIEVGRAGVVRVGYAHARGHRCGDQVLAGSSPTARARSLPGVTTPRRDSHGRIIRDQQWRVHVRHRATIEHVIARVKDWHVLRQCRRKRAAIDQIIRAVAAIYKHRIELRLNS